MSGVDEHATYKVPEKLPAIVKFKRNQESGMMEPVVYNDTRSHMLRTSTNEGFKSAMNEFLQQK